MSCPHLTRRRFVAGSGAMIVTAGCIGGDEEAPAVEPIDLGDGQTCDVCGMVIAEHYGPNALVFYADDRPEDRDGPAWFDSVRERLDFDEDQGARGWEALGYFVTDYSAVEYELIDENGDRFISSHVEAGDFVDAEDAVFVVDSPVQGAMGPDYFPFSARDDAEHFAAEEGGTVRTWDALTSA